MCQSGFIGDVNIFTWLVIQLAVVLYLGVLVFNPSGLSLLVEITVLVCVVQIYIAACGDRDRSQQKWGNGVVCL